MSSNLETIQICPPTGSKDSSPQDQVKISARKQTASHASSSMMSTKNRIPIISSAQSTAGGAKSHKVEGKNKKSLHQKQQQLQQANLNQNCVFQQARSQRNPHDQQQQQVIATNSSNRGKKSNNIGKASPSPPSSTTNKPLENTVNIFSTLEDFSKIAQELKAEINKALAKQASHHTTDQPVEIVKLKNDILKLSGLDTKETGKEKQNEEFAEVKTSPESLALNDHIGDLTSDVDAKPNLVDDNKNPTSNKCNESETTSQNNISDQSSLQPLKNLDESSQNKSGLTMSSHGDTKDSAESALEAKKADVTNNGYKSDIVFINAIEKLNLNDQKESPNSPGNDGSSQRVGVSARSGDKITSKRSITSEEFAPLETRLDFESKLVTLTSSLRDHFADAPHLLDPICRKLVNMSDSSSHLVLTCEKYRNENRKLILVKQKLEALCRELQKSNNEIRIESLDLIKAEQGKAKDQTAKIQSTLSEVIKLFDENQQRNMSLRQENQDLQTKLKSLLDHCDNWEKSIEAALRQRDIENRLLKTELAKANLLKNEEQEKFLGEKQELLQILSMMQEQQHRIEGQEAKLRSDLSSYASKYDECQAVISKGMDRFQAESKRMLKQIEKSRQDYKVLLTKYETTNKRTTQLLEEKQEWHRSLNTANKKIETLEKLCRALSDRKQEAMNDNKQVVNDLEAAP